MIRGVGLDLVELHRIQSLIERNEKFSRRILTEQEYEHYSQLSSNRKIEYLAGRFSAKEAFAKAIGTGIGKELSFQDMAILNEISGKPYMEVKKFTEFKIHLSITHTKEYAAAQVIVED